MTPRFDCLPLDALCCQVTQNPADGGTSFDADLTLAVSRAADPAGAALREVGGLRRASMRLPRALPCRCLAGPVRLRSCVTRWQRGTTGPGLARQAMWRCGRSSAGSARLPTHRCPLRPLCRPCPTCCFIPGRSPPRTSLLAVPFASCGGSASPRWLFRGLRTPPRPIFRDG